MILEKILQEIQNFYSNLKAQSSVHLKTRDLSN